MSDEDRLVTPDEAAELLGVPASVLAVWKSRNRIVPVDWIRGRGHGGLVPLYMLSDLRPKAAAYHRAVARHAARRRRL